MIIWMKRFLKALGLSAGLTLGCDSAPRSGPASDPPAAATPPGDDPSGPADPVATDPKPPPVIDEGALGRVDQNLERLRALELFEVGELMVMSPGAGGSCYDVPCPDEVEAVRARLASELERLAALSEDLDGGGERCDPALVGADAGAHLETLAGLRIVEIGAFLEVAPANNPMCYNLPCQEDVATADAANCDKVGRLAELAERAAAEFDVDAVTAPSAAIEAIDDNLRDLAALELFEVGELLIGATLQQDNCYLCPLDLVEQDEAMAATRLQALRDVAAAEVGDYRGWELEASAGCELSDADRDLAALAALQIIEVGTLIVRDPAAEGLCYAGGCGEAEYALAHALACRRAAALATLTPHIGSL